MEPSSTGSLPVTVKGQCGWRVRKKREGPVRKVTYDYEHFSFLASPRNAQRGKDQGNLEESNVQKEAMNEWMRE